MTIAYTVTLFVNYVCISFKRNTAKWMTWWRLLLKKYSLYLNTFPLTDGYTKQRCSFERHCQSMRCVTECCKKSRGPVFKFRHPVPESQNHRISESKKEARWPVIFSGLFTTLLHYSMTNKKSWHSSLFLFLTCWTKEEHLKYLSGY